jgi:hypothetical protein
MRESYLREVSWAKLVAAQASERGKGMTLRKTPGGREVTLRETTRPTQDGRQWEAHLVREDIWFAAVLTGTEQSSTPGGTAPIQRPFTAVEVERAVLSAIDADLVRPPEKKSGGRYNVNVTCYDLYRAAGVAV